MKRNLFILIALLFTLFLNAIEPHFLEDPAISPDGETVCFSYLSDLWLVPFEGGEAKRITVSKANEWGPIFTPDGKYIFLIQIETVLRKFLKCPPKVAKQQCILKKISV